MCKGDIRLAHSRREGLAEGLAVEVEVVDAAIRATVESRGGEYPAALEPVKTKGASWPSSVDLRRKLLQESRLSEVLKHNDSFRLCADLSGARGPGLRKGSCVHQAGESEEEPESRSEADVLGIRRSFREGPLGSASGAGDFGPDRSEEVRCHGAQLLRPGRRSPIRTQHRGAGSILRAGQCSDPAPRQPVQRGQGISGPDERLFGRPEGDPRRQGSLRVHSAWIRNRLGGSASCGRAAVPFRLEDEIVAHHIPPQGYGPTSS